MLEPRTLLAGTASIAGLVFSDLDGDGSRGASEPGVGGVTVYLDLNDNGALGAGEPTATTAADGSYALQNLDAGNYVVRELAPANHRITSPQASGQRLFVVDGLGPPHRIVELNPITGAQIRNFAAPCTGITIFAGLAFDGTTLYSMCDANDTLYRLDPNTGAVLGSTVLAAGPYGSVAALGGKLYILNPNNDTVFIFDPSSNNVTGSYRFQSGVDPQDSLGSSPGTNELLFAANYSIGFVDPATGFRTHSFQMAGPNYGFDATSVEAVGNEIFVTHSSVSKIEVYSRAGVLLRTLNISPVLFLNEAAGWADLTGAHRLSLTAGQAATNVNFGDQIALASIRGTRWQDANGNGLRDSGEQALAGKTMYLDLNDNAARDAGEPTALTGANGSFVFTNLQPGTYVVRSEVTAGYTQTFPADTKTRLFGSSGVPARIYELNPTTGAVINSFPPPQSFAEPLAFDGKWLFYASIGNDTLYKLNPDTGAVLGTLPLPLDKLPFGIAAVGGLLYLNLQGSFAIVDPVTMTFGGTITMDSHLGPFWEVGQMNDPQRLLGIGTAGEIIQVDPATAAPSIGFSVPIGFSSITAFGSKFYVGDGTRNLRVYSSVGTLLQTITNVPVDQGLAGIAGAGGAQRITLTAGQNATGADFGTTEPIPPVAADDGGYSTPEDTDLVVAAPGVLQNDTDPGGLPPVTAVKVSDPAHGTVTLNANGSFTYRPDADYTGEDSFTYQARNSAVGGNVATVTLTVTPVNDPPTLSAIAPAAVLEDAGETIVNLTAISAGPREDQALIVTATSSKPGLIPNPTVNYNSPAATGTLSFTPVTNQSGTVVITVTVKDDGGTAGGGIDTFTRTFTVNVAPVNDPPSGLNTTISALDHMPRFFSVRDFGFSDPVDNPPNSLAGVRIMSLPQIGTLMWGAATLTAGQLIPLNSSDLIYTPAANSFDTQAGYASFTFQVQDDGGTAQGGVDVDPESKTLTIDLAGVSNAPAGGNNTVTTAEDRSYSFSASDFAFIDPGDNPPNVLAAVKISTLPDRGTLTLGQAPVAPGDVVPISQIAPLVYTPAANANGPAYGQFSFQVQDDGVPAGGGSNLDPTPRTMTIDVTPVNDAPVTSNRILLAREDTPHTFSATDFAFADPADLQPPSSLPGNVLSAVILTVPPASAASILFSGQQQSPGSVMTVNVGQLGQLVFVPILNSNSGNSPSPTIVFRVQDDGGTLNNGQDTSLPATLTMSIASVNDPPVGQNSSRGGLEDEILTFSAADFGFADPSDTPPNAFAALRIASAPTRGSLRNGIAVLSSGAVISRAAIDAGDFQFVPAPNGNGTSPPYDSFTFQVQDDGGTLLGGLDTDPVDRTMLINVTPVNDRPTGANKAIPINEDVTYTIPVSDFGFSDASDQPPISSTPPDQLLNVIFPNAPTAGTLKVGSFELTTFPATIAAAEFTANNVTFTPLADKNSANTPSFAVTFHVQDSGNPADGNNTDATPRTLAFNVASVNDPPVGQDNTINIDEDRPYTLGVSDFPLADSHDTPPNALHAIIVVTTPVGGTLFNGSSPISTGTTLLSSDVGAGFVRFVPASNANRDNTAAFGFTFRVRDTGGVSNNGFDTDPTPHTLSFNVTPVNDPPTATPDSFTILEDGELVFTGAMLIENDSDIEGGPLTALVGLPVDGRTDHGMFTFVIGGGVSTFTYRPDPNFHGTDVIRYQAYDGDAASSFVTITINVAPVNDEPSCELATVPPATDESGALAIANWAVCVAGPPNEAAQGVQLLVQENSNPDLFAATPVIDAAGTLRFTPRPNKKGSAQVTLIVQDSGGTGSGGSDTSGPHTFTIVVTKPRPLHNAAMKNDVTADGSIVAADAVAVINHINAFGSGPISDGAAGPPYVDTSGDNSIAANDALAVINHINAFGAGTAGGEGEGGSERRGNTTSPDDDLLALLALDLAAQPKRRRA